MESVGNIQKSLGKLDFPENQKESIVEVIDIKTDDAVSRLENKMDVGFKLLRSEIQCQNGKIDSIKTYMSTTVGIDVLVAAILGLTLKLWVK